MLADPTSRLGGWVLETPRWKFVTAVFVVMFLRTGVTSIAETLLPIAENPYRNPFTNPYAHYQLWNWLGPFLAHQLGATSRTSLTLFYLTFSVLFSVLMVRWMFANLDDRLGRVALLVFALFPVSATAYYWVFTDSLTLFLLASALYFPRNWAVVGGLGVALGMQHFEQALVAAGAALFVTFWTERRGVRLPYDRRWASALLVGSILGKLMLMWIFAHLDIQVNSGRWFWLLNSWPLMLRRFATTFHFALFSAFGVGWLVVITFLRRRSADALPVGVTIASLLLLMPVSDDPTRVFAIVTFPVVSVYLLRNAEFLATIPREGLGLLALLGCLVPWTFVWAGKAIGSAALLDALQVLRYLLHMPHALTGPRFPP